MIEVTVLQFGEQAAALAEVRQACAGGAFTEVASEVVAPEEASVRRAVRTWADTRGVELVLTIGGVGLGPRDRVPEAMNEVVERWLPGLAELARLGGLRNDPRAALWRNAAGSRSRTLIVNLPAEGAGLALRSLASVLPDAVRMLRSTGN